MSRSLVHETQIIANLAVLDLNTKSLVLVFNPYIGESECHDCLPFVGRLHDLSGEYKQSAIIRRQQCSRFSGYPHYSQPRFGKIATPEAEPLTAQNLRLA
ncbi:MAG: hypothetical protein AAFR90_00115 [Pseudomonadota bacterium]